MAMKGITVLISVITIWVVGNVQSATAPAPAVDCSTLVLNMADCLSYVTNGSNVNKPEGSCCSGLKTVLKTGAECLCEAFKNSAQLGVTLNVTKAMALPKACHVSAPSATNCGASLSTGGAPAASPAAAVSPSSPAAAVAGENEMAPAPAPGLGSTAAAPRLVASIGSLVLALAVASFSSIWGTY